MKHLLFPIVFFVLYSVPILGQEIFDCVVTSNTGSKISGFYEHVDSPLLMSTESEILISNGFKLRTKDDVVHKISPKEYTTVQLDSLLYRSLPNNKGKLRFMRVLYEGPKASLYLDKFLFASNSQGYRMTALVIDPYLKRGSEWQEIKQGLLIRKPEVYFPDAPPLCKFIKNAKKDNLQLVKWVAQYNEIDWEN